MTYARKTPILLAVALVFAFATSAYAGEETYTFGTHDARTNISFVSEADIETIHGFTNQIVGTVRVADGKLVAPATLEIDVASLDTGIELRNEHLQGEMWLDAAKHPKIVLELTSATQQGDSSTWKYQGTLTIKGTSKPIAGEAKIKFVDEQKAKRFKLGDGAWVSVKTDFDVKLSDFGVQIPEGVAPKVNDTWDVSIDLWGTTSPQPQG